MIVSGRDATDSHDLFLAYRADNGELAWRVEYPAPGQIDYGNSPRATPLIADGKAFLWGAFGHLHAVSLASGEILWERHLAREFHTPRLEWGLASSPLLVAGKLVVPVGGAQAGLVALEPDTGKIVWQSKGGKPGHASFVAATVGGRLQVIGYDARSLGGWDAATGERLWTVTPDLDGDFNVPTPIWLPPNRLFVATENNGARLYSLDESGVANPVPVATYADLNPDSHTPVSNGRRLYGIANGLHCLDLDQNLMRRWLHDDPSFGDYASLVLAGELLLATTRDAELILLRDEGAMCRELARCRLAEDESTLSHPAVYGRRLFVRFGSTLAALDLDGMTK